VDVCITCISCFGICISGNGHTNHAGIDGQSGKKFKKGVMYSLDYPIKKSRVQ